MLVAFTQWKYKSECDTVIKWSVHSALVILDKVSTSTTILTMVLILRSILFSPLLVQVSTSTTILTITLLCWKPALIKDKVYKVESGLTLQAKFVGLSEILSSRWKWNIVYLRSVIVSWSLLFHTLCPHPRCPVLSWASWGVLRSCCSFVLVQAL
jgi:hypothetical protein